MNTPTYAKWHDGSSFDSPSFSSRAVQSGPVVHLPGWFLGSGQRIENHEPPTQEASARNACGKASDDQRIAKAGSMYEKCKSAYCILLFFLMAVMFPCAAAQESALPQSEQELLAQSACDNSKENFWNSRLKKLKVATSMRISWRDCEEKWNYIYTNDCTISGGIFTHMKELLMRHTVYNKEVFMEEVDYDLPYPCTFPIYYPMLTFYDKEGNLLLDHLYRGDFYPSAEKCPKLFSLPPEILAELDEIIMTLALPTRENYRENRGKPVKTIFFKEWKRRATPREKGCDRVSDSF